MRRKLLFLLIGILLAAVFFTWLSKSSWLPEWNQQLAEQAKVFRTDGLELGRRADQQACLSTALQRFDQCTGFACTVNHGILLKACLEEAAPSVGFCDAVPEFEEKPSEDAKSWARDYCWSRDIRGEGCRLLMRQQQFFCSGKEWGLADSKD